MFLRSNRRFKDGKEHRYWNIVENRRCAGGKVVQRQVLYLGEIDDGQRDDWSRAIEAFDEDAQRHTQLSLFSADRELPRQAEGYGVQVRIDGMELHRPRQWGACWLSCELYEQLGLDQFWARRLPPSREGTNWCGILQTLVCYRLIDPGSEWRLHRQWFEHSAMADLLGADFMLAEKNALYRCLDKLLPHKQSLFSHLRQRWVDLFSAKFEVLLYDLTSTYFESAPPDDDNDKRRFGYSRDKRSDCVQMVIALIVTPDGFALAYEVLPGNTADCTTLREFLHKIETQYGKAQRIWVMDRGIPHRCGAGGDAAGRSAGLLSGRNAEGTAVETGAGAARQALAGGARGCRRQGADPGPGDLRLRAKPRPHPQGTRHAPAQAQMALVTIEANREHEAHAQGIPDEARCRAFQGSRGVAVDRHRYRPQRDWVQLQAQPREVAPGAPT
jgi:hypothetical protein